MSTTRAVNEGGKVRKPTWTTKDGEEIEIAFMSSSHLLATIHFIERNRFVNAAEVYGYRFNTADADTTAEGVRAVHYYLRWPDAYDALVTEATRRKLLHRPAEGPVPKGSRRSMIRVPSKAIQK